MLIVLLSLIFFFVRSEKKEGRNIVVYALSFLVNAISRHGAPSLLAHLCPVTYDSSHAKICSTLHSQVVYNVSKPAFILGK
jgi:hypothetical protein